MSAHTPGPWTVDPDDTDEFGLYRIREIDPARYHQGQDGANARLIAAAPDLLRDAAEALERLDMIVCPPTSNTWTFRERLRATIARATGASS